VDVHHLVGKLSTAEIHLRCKVEFSYSVKIPTRCSFVIEFIIPKFIELSINFGIINSITKLHLLGISTE
jgi:hypothetical protein